MKKRFTGSGLALALLLIGFVCSSQADDSHVSTPARPIEPSSTYVHGTIDIVISTREGFVLASDSRGSKSDGTHADDAQKIFTVGSQAACVVAGLIGSEIGMEGFHLTDAIGTHLLALDKRAGQQQVSAVDLARSFEDRFGSVAGLLMPGTASSPGIMGAVSAVSISPEGKAQWITFYLPIQPRTENGVFYITTGSPQYFVHSLSLGVRFDVHAIGFPFIADAILQAEGPSNSVPGSQLPVLQKFYERKRNGQLDQFTLAEAVELARTLVEVTIQFAPPEAGVGGPIDILTITKRGLTWVKKKEFVPFAPPYRVRFFGGGIRGGKQDLDGLEWIRGSFSNVDLTYTGDADVELIGCKFEDACKLRIASGAKQKRPDVVERLKRVLGPHCQVTEE